MPKPAFIWEAGNDDSGRPRGRGTTAEHLALVPLAFRARSTRIFRIGMWRWPIWVCWSKVSGFGG